MDVHEHPSNEHLFGEDHGPPGPSRIRRGTTVRTVAALALGALVVAGAVMGRTLEDADRAESSGGGYSTALGDDAGVPAANTGGAVGTDGVDGSSADAAPASGGGPALPAAEPRIVRSARLEVEVEEGSLRAALDRVLTAAARFDGLVAATALHERESEDHGGSASVTVRIPADRFDEARRELSGLGELASLEITGQDVSGQLVDLDARVRNLRAQETALLELLGRAEQVGEIIQVQTQVFEVRDQIERLAAQQAVIEDRVALATLDVVLFEPGAVFSPSPEPATGLAKAWDDAVAAAESVVAGMIVALGFVSPIVLLAALAWVLLRGRRPSGVATAG